MKKQSWNDLNIKDKISYLMSIILILSGIIMAFICFFITENHDITNGVLFYVSESFVTGGSLLGIGLYIKGKFSEMNTYIHQQIDRK